MNSQNTTKGLDIARDFFQEWGLPYLQNQQSHLVGRVAALIFGGSESLRNDDELSRDHNWGPRFELVLTGEDMKRYGRRLARQINQVVPHEWKGFTFRSAKRSSIHVSSINPWFQRTVGCAQPPKKDRGWYGRTREYNLYMLRHATVFHDPLGEFSARRQAFWYYPDYPWLQRVIRETWLIWHFGQYNFRRCLTVRQDPVAISVCIGRFTESVMRLLMLLARDYTPYWKWLAAEFRKLPDVVRIDTWLRDLSKSQDIDTQAHLVDQINDEIHTRLVAEFDLDPHPQEHPHPLFCAKNELVARAGGSSHPSWVSPHLIPAPQFPRSWKIYPQVSFQIPIHRDTPDSPYFPRQRADSPRIAARTNYLYAKDSDSCRCTQ